MTRAQQQSRGALTRAVVDAGVLALGTRAAFAEWAGTHRRQLTRLASGQRLGDDEGWRLATLAAVVTALLAIYEPEAIPGWLQGNNPHLNARRPLDVLAEGDAAGVMAAVQALRTGVYA